MRRSALLFAIAWSLIAASAAFTTTDQAPEGDSGTDGTAETETEGTIDIAVEVDEAGQQWTLSGDLRPIFSAAKVDLGDGETTSAEELALRTRLNAVGRASPSVHFGAGLAGRCSTSGCDLDLVLQRTLPTPNGLADGQFTLDELFIHWHRGGADRRVDLLAGRFQTRFVLRGGVFAKSLDRNDSNNARITWTDGLHASRRGRRGWRTDLVWQRNDEGGTGSIRRGPLDFSSSDARNTVFVGLENTRAWGPVVQRSLDVSYLPDTLLRDQDPTGRRSDYWGFVGRLAGRWPQRSRGPRFRGGLEVGYAPRTQTEAGSGHGSSGDVGGLAWNIVANGMDLAPGHSVGANYGHTEAGWLLSPQFFPNSELFEIRYQWRPANGPLFEARVRWQEELDEPGASDRVRDEVDVYLRLTWEFGATTTRMLQGGG